MNEYDSIQKACIHALTDAIADIKIDRVETPFIDDNDAPLPINLIVGNFYIDKNDKSYNFEIHVDENRMGLLIIFPFSFKAEWNVQVLKIINELNYDTMDGGLSHKGFDDTEIYYKTCINLNGVNLTLNENSKVNYKLYYLLFRNKFEDIHKNIKEWHANLQDYAMQKISLSDFFKRLGDW